MKQDIKSMTLSELESALRELGEPAFRARQVYTWLPSGRGVVSGHEQPFQGSAGPAWGAV